MDGRLHKFIKIEDINLSQHYKSQIVKIGGMGKCRIFVTENGDSLISETDAAFSAIVGDTAEYWRKEGGKLTIIVWYSKEHQTIKDTRKKEEEHSTMIVPVYVPR